MPNEKYEVGDSAYYYSIEGVWKLSTIKMKSVSARGNLVYYMLDGDWYTPDFIKPIETISELY